MMKLTTCLLLALLAINAVNAQEEELLDSFLEMEDEPILRQSAPTTFQAGYFRVRNESDSALHYAFYPAKYSDANNITAIPIIIWLNGGPGTSSQVGNYKLIGPNAIVKEGEGGEAKYTEIPKITSHWNNEYSLLFVDNPVGTGYSYAAKPEDYPTNSSEVAWQFCNFLVNLLKSDQFSAFQKAKKPTPIYLFGEDYAGHFIAPIAARILNENQKNYKTKNIVINLKGIGIGGGWVDPKNQLSEFGSFAYSLGFIDDLGREQIEKYQLQARFRIDNQDYDGCYETLGKIISIFQQQSYISNFNNYRTNRLDMFHDLETFMNYEETRKKFKVDERVKKWSVNHDTVKEKLRLDICTSVARDFSFIIPKLPVLIWNGQTDVICNTPSVLQWLTRLDWVDAKEWRHSYRIPFMANGRNAGVYKSHKNLNWVVLNQAGHLAPQDQPEATLEMVKTFISGKF